MGLVTVNIQGADGDTHEVVLDDVGSDLYPIYKLSFGALGVGSNLVTSTTPLPTEISDGIDTLGVFGDGDTASLENPAGVVGTTKGIAGIGVDPNESLRLLRTSTIGRLEIDGIRSALAMLNDTMERIQQQLSFITGLEIEPGKGTN